MNGGRRLEFLSRQPIRRKLIALVLLVSSIGVVLAGGILIAYHLVSIHRNIIIGIKAQAELVANSCSTVLASADRDAGEALLGALRADPSVTAAFLFRADGTIVAEYRTSGLEPPPQPVRPQTSGFHFQDKRLYVYREVLLESRPAGQLCIVHTLAALPRFFWHSIVTLAAVAFLTAGCAFLLASRLQQLISEPLIELTETARRITETRDFSLRAETRGRDEPGVLGEAFNDMLNQIQDRDAALRRSEQRFRSIVESTPMGIHVYQLQADGRLVFVGANPAADTILGVDNSQFVGKTIEEAFPPLAESEIPARYRAAALDGAAWHVEQVDYADDHIRGAFEVHAFQTAPGRMVAMFSDITARKQAEQALRTRERFLACLSQVSLWLVERHDPAVVLGKIVALLGETADVDRCSLVENEYAAGRVIGRRRHQWSSESARDGSGVPELGDVAFIEQGLERWTEVLARGELIAATVAELPEQERAWLEARGFRSVLVAPLLVSGEWHGLVAFEDSARDRRWEQETDLLRIAASEIAGAIENARLLAEVQGSALDLAERVAERTAALEAVNHELEAFAYSVSHDLRAPLRSIDGFSQALLEDCGEQVSDTGREHLRRVRAASQRMGRLIDELLELSRVTRRELHRQRVDLSALARSIAEELADAHPEREVELAIADGVSVQADTGLLRVVLQNLLDNAFKFTSKRDGARIEVGATSVGNERVYHVRDNGIGFDMEYADNLFGAFQRLHRDSEFEGTGVGLATVQRIIQRHGGSIWAEAAVNQGATFYFTLSA